MLNDADNTYNHCMCCQHHLLQFTTRITSPAVMPACALHVLLFASADTQIRHEHIQHQRGRRQLAQQPLSVTN